MLWGVRWGERTLHADVREHVPPVAAEDSERDADLRGGAAPSSRVIPRRDLLLQVRVRPGPMGSFGETRRDPSPSLRMTDDA